MITAEQNFNCTIQELKLSIYTRKGAGPTKFQLHHTGIKTKLSKKSAIIRDLFQLHHTGIKTCETARGLGISANFNCTIQELKLEPGRRLLYLKVYFNCTIQELKHRADRSRRRGLDISIAPYRN